MSSGPGKSGSSREHDHEKPTVILLGDSIWGGYQNNVVTALEGKATVWSPKENGQHTGYTLQQLEKWIKGCEASVVHINVGLHDLFLSSKTDESRHSFDVYTANLRRIFTKLKQLTDAEIIFALTTPVDDQRQASSETYKRVVRRNSEISTYNRRAVEIATEFGVRVNDLHAVVLEMGVGQAIRDDGVHLSANGGDVVGEQVAHSILPARNKQNHETR